MSLTLSGLIPFLQQLNADAANSTSLIDAADECAFLILQVPKAGTITHVGWRTIAVTTGAVVDVRVEGVDATGLPDGVLVGTTTNGAETVVTATPAWHRTALTLGATVTQGQEIAVGVVNPTVSFGNMTIMLMLEGLRPASKYPYRVAANRTTKQAIGPPAFLLEYDDGTFAPTPGLFPLLRLAGAAANTGTNPDEIGLLFTPDVPMRCTGLGANCIVAAGANFRGALYQSGNNTPLATTPTIDGDHSGDNQTGFRHHFFTTSVELAAGTSYRISLVPLTANSVTFLSGEVPSTGAREIFTKSDAQWTARNRSSTTDPDSAAWTETTTRITALWPLLDELDDGAGSGGGGGPLIGGRLVR